MHLRQRKTQKDMSKVRGEVFLARVQRRFPSLVPGTSIFSYSNERDRKIVLGSERIRETGIVWRKEMQKEKSAYDDRERRG